VHHVWTRAEWNYTSPVALIRQKAVARRRGVQTMSVTNIHSAQQKTAGGNVLAPSPEHVARRGQRPTVRRSLGIGVPSRCGRATLQVAFLVPCRSSMVHRAWAASHIEAAERMRAHRSGRHPRAKSQLGARMSTGDATAPVCCPTCRSQDLVAPGNKTDVETYWRCRKCGDMWNVSRLRTENTGNFQSFGRPRPRSW
jgi:hypothetical protein